MTSKPKTVVYAVDTGGMPKGPKYQNPDWFDAVHKDAAQVYVVGHYPEIVETYKRLGIPVETVERYPLDGAAPMTEAAPIVRRAGHIPDNWESLPWAGDGATIRSVAQQFSEAPVINSRHAAKIIREELVRRSA